MKAKTKKILRRVGAAFLLGLSFFNFGSSWGRQRAKSVPRRTQNIRKQTQEELDTEIQQVANVAETEALKAINQEVQKQEQQYEMKQQAQSQAQQGLRYAIMGGWGLGMALFFTSMIFNQPFGLGKAILALLPGEPHIATLAVIAEDDLWRIGENGVVDIELSTNEEGASYLKAVVKYNPEILEFQKIKLDSSKFDVLEQNIVDNNKGEITLIVKKTGEARAFNRDTVARLIFKALKKKDKVTVKLVQEESVVIKIKQEDKKGHNILGKIKNDNFRIINKLSEIIKCRQFKAINKAQWVELINSDLVPLGDKNNWVELNETTSLLCAHSEDGKVSLLIHSEEKVSDVVLMNKLTGNKSEIINKEDWLDNKKYFHVVTVDNFSKIARRDGDKFGSLSVSFRLGNEMIKWPKKRYAEFILE